MAKNTLAKNQKGYNYSYTDLAQIHSFLEAKGWSYYQYTEPVICGDQIIDYVFTVKIIDGKEMPPVRGCRVIQASLKGNNNPAQEQGSGLTYARRYSLLMAFGLCTSDDDAEMLSDRSNSKEATKKVTKTQAKTISNMADSKGVDIGAILDNYGIDRLEDMTALQYANCLSRLSHN